MDVHKKVLNQGIGHDQFPNVFLIDNKMCSDKDLISNKFNEYFTQIIMSASSSKY